MKTAPVVLVVLAAVVTLVVSSGSTPVPAQPAPGQPAAWEYRLLPVTFGNAAKEEKALNDLGAAGWEVVESVSTTQGGNGTLQTDARLVLKRAKR